MNPFEMVVLIIAMVVLVSILRGRHIRVSRKHGVEMGDNAETQRHREEMQALKDRVAVLERIVTDRGLNLADEIEKLRDSRVN